MTLQRFVVSLRNPEPKTALTGDQKGLPGGRNRPAWGPERRRTTRALPTKPFLIFMHILTPIMIIELQEKKARTRHRNRLSRGFRDGKK